jgi:hypothetical protein
MTLILQLSNFLFSPRHRRGLSRFGYHFFPDWNLCRLFLFLNCRRVGGNWRRET